MRLPNANRAIVDIAKLRDYSLNSLHPEGKHKARVFQAALGFKAEDAVRLRELILTAIMTNNAEARTPTPYGQRFVVDFDATGPMGEARIRTAWIVRNEEKIPRLTSCYIL
jgi:hypothetical protein